MITNRMRRMSKRRQKIELLRQARLVAQAINLNEAAAEGVYDVTVANVTGERPAPDSSPTPVAR